MNSIVRSTISEMLEIKSVAIVGVSAKMGYYWAHSMLQWDHNLKVWLVSRSGEEVLAHKIYRSLLDIPEPVDYVILAVPLRAVPEVLECAQKGVKGATIFTSGYSELGTEEGRQREKEIKDLIHSMSFRVFGPNCMGLMSPRIGFAFMPTVDRLSGNVGFVSQSGGIAITVYTAAVHAGVGFSKMFSFGNAVDISPYELLDYLQTDQETDVVGVYIEGTSDGKQLLESLKRVAEKKPVVVVKGGRSIEGSRAVSSHTGALAGRDEIWDAAFRQANVVAVDTLENLLESLR
jgi:acyl-CoA synthetase (NDP forming)